MALCFPTLLLSVHPQHGRTGSRPGRRLSASRQVASQPGEVCALFKWQKAKQTKNMLSLWHSGALFTKMQMMCDWRWLCWWELTPAGLFQLHYMITSVTFCNHWETFDHWAADTVTPTLAYCNSKWGGYFLIKAAYIILQWKLIIMMMALYFNITRRLFFQVSPQPL